MTDIITQPKKNIILDATMLTSIMTCARFTDLRFNHSFQSIDGKSNSLECGSIVHKVLETYYECLINHHKRESAIQHALVAGELYIKECQYCTDFIPSETEIKPRCNHLINEYPGVKNTPPDSDSKTYKTGWKYVLETCEQYFEFYKSDFWTPLETEVVKREVLFEDDEIRIMWKAKLDLTVDTNQGIFPVDHKTMKQRRDTLSLNNQFIGQCILMKTRNVIINKIGFQTSLEPKDKFIRSVVSYSSDRILEWQSEILPYWAYQLVNFNEVNHYPPNFTHCESKYGNCMFKSVCESDRGMREEVLKNEFIVGPIWDIDNLEKE